MDIPRMMRSSPSSFKGFLFSLNTESCLLILYFRRRNAELVELQYKYEKSF